MMYLLGASIRMGALIPRYNLENLHLLETARLVSSRLGDLTLHYEQSFGSSPPCRCKPRHQHPFPFVAAFVG